MREIERGKRREKREREREREIERLRERERETETRQRGEERVESNSLVVRATAPQHCLAINPPRPVHQMLLQLHV